MVEHTNTPEHLNGYPTNRLWRNTFGVEPPVPVGRVGGVVGVRAPVQEFTVNIETVLLRNTSANWRDKSFCG